MRKITPIFQNTLQKTEDWLSDVTTELGYEDIPAAYTSFRAVTHALRDRLTPSEAANLASNMPMLVRGFYFEGWRPEADTQRRYRHKQEFLDHVAKLHPRLSGDAVEDTVRGVFRVLGRHVPEGEIRDVKAQLPEDLRALWPEQQQTRPPSGDQAQL